MIDNMKEIHFYTNLTNEEQTSEKDLDDMCVDWFTTNAKIKTTQLSFLRNTWDYIGRGYKVFIHNDSVVYDVKEHMTGVNKDIRWGNDVSRLLIGGLFGELC